MFGGFIQTFTAGAAPLKFLSRSTQRWNLIIGPPLAGSITVFNNSNVVSGAGFNLQPTFGYLELRANRHGDAVQQEWFVVADAAGRSFGFIESLGSPCEMIAMLIDELGVRGDADDVTPNTIAAMRHKLMGIKPQR